LVDLFPNLFFSEIFLKLVGALRGGRPFIPRGVHRFHTHEEKDA